MTVALAVAGMLLCLVVIALLAATSPRDLWAPRVLGRSYSGVPLEKVIAELERDRIIPPGTRWARPELKATLVSVRVRFLSTDLETLQQVASAAGVQIAVPVGIEGEIQGPVLIGLNEDGHKPGIWRYFYRNSSWDHAHRFPGA